MIKVADFLIRRQREMRLSNRDVAELVGYENANVISMIRKGDTKLPINKVGEFAKALEVDSVWLMRLAMREYMPETLCAIENCLGPLVSQSEHNLLRMWRSATKGTDPEICDDLANGVVQLLAVSKASALRR